MLTPGQKACLLYLHRRISADGIAPTVTEICIELGLHRGAVHRLLTALEARGAIRKLPRKSRAIEILTMNPGMAALSVCPSCGHHLLGRAA